MKKVIASPLVPPAVGPYSQAIENDGLLITSGQLGIDKNTGKIPEDLEEEVRQVFYNLRAVLVEAGYDFENVMKTTVFLTDLGNFQLLNQIYAEYFTSAYPARSCYQVGALPAGARVEIEAIARK